MERMFGREFVVLFSVFVELLQVDASKLRTWVGPNSLMGGAPPGVRRNPGLAASADGKLFVFGGYDLLPSKLRVASELDII